MLCEREGDTQWPICILEYFIRRSHMRHIWLHNLPTEMYIYMYLFLNPNAYERNVLVNMQY